VMLTALGRAEAGVADLEKIEDELHPLFAFSRLYLRWAQAKAAKAISVVPSAASAYRAPSAISCSVCAAVALGCVIAVSVRAR